MTAGLTKEQLRVAECTGMTPEQFAAVLTVDAAQAQLTASMKQPTQADIFAKCGLISQEFAKSASLRGWGGDVGVAQCAFIVAALSARADGRVLLQITPAHDFTPSDGRAMQVPAWRINAEIASRIIAAHNPAQPPVIDYEHQTIHTEKNGQPAPAAGWMHALQWIEGKGLHALAELTDKAKQSIKSGEYRYFSPVFQYHPTTGEITRILMGALTNNPAIHGMTAIAV